MRRINRQEDAIGARRGRGVVIAGAFAVLAVLALAGCGTSAPRFRTAEAEESTMARRIREEETREDDRRVDVGKIRRRLTPSVKPRPAEEHPLPAGLNRDRMLVSIVSHLGIPYLYGGTGKKGMDCSAFTSKVYESAVRTSIPRSTAEQFERGADVEREDLRFGDLVFFNTTGRNPSHVGIYIEDDLFAHASVSYGVTISSMESSYYHNRFVGARRIVR
jgi:cell wall-associated NlpC family hydrolase